MGVAGVVLSVFLGHLIYSQSGYTEAQCSSDWFGPLCQYKCRCTNDQCDVDGNCKPGSKCLPGWFGPSCQYYNLARLSRRSYLSPVVTDEDDTTCNRYEDLMSMRGSWSATYHFSWLRLIVNQQASNVFDQITVIINNNGIETTCADLTRVDVDNRTQDIHCPNSVLMSEIQLTGLGVKSLCSLYISGGRNVALKQHTSQSSTFKYQFWNPPWFDIDMNSGDAVDGKPISGSSNYSCSSTNYQYKPTWYLTLSESKIVNRYTVYSTAFYTDKLSGFILESYDENKQLVLQYRDQGAIKPSYEIIGTTSDQRVQNVIIYAGSHATLTLCEVELYGDSDCPRGQYGRDCELSCNCDVKSDSCFVSTGGCPSGCPAGFYGEGCRKACDNGRFGKGCTQMCSDQCAKVVCAATDGTCVDGCREGYKPPLCYDEIPSIQELSRSTECDSGFYGRNCTQPCPKNCNGTCEKENGACLHGCIPGYEGTFCDKEIPSIQELSRSTECDSGFYGRNCTQPCPKNCNGTCEKENGACLHGCIPGYEGTLCDKALPLPTSGDTSLPIAMIVGPTSAVIILIIVAVVGVFICRRRYKRAADGQSIPDKFQGDAETESRSTVVESVGGAIKTNTEIIDKNKTAENVYEMA